VSEWTKHLDNPVLGPGYCLQAVFDCCVIPEGDRLLSMWLSWRDLRSIAYCESEDGANWTAPRIVLEVNPQIEWEKDNVNRPHILQVGDTWYMWYTGQSRDTQTSQIGLATSRDGEHWERIESNPVLTPAGGWEKGSLMCPHVLYEDGKFRMWYSGGEMYEPDAIGYAESADGIHWERHPDNPIIRPVDDWERDRVTAACIVPRENDYLAFYIGFAEGFEKSTISVARSADGIHDWERYPGNPIIRPGPPGSWEDCNVYKPYVVRYRDRWYLWYNGSRFSDRREQIGLATTPEIDF
jgi:predicted GH43/DUF377 family glycosyl hydrolase